MSPAVLEQGSLNITYIKGAKSDSVSETMAGLWKTFVLVVALAVVACEALRQLRYEEIVDRAIEAYNQGRQGRPLFRLLSATPPSSQVSICHPSLENRQCRSLLPGYWACSSVG